MSQTDWEAHKMLDIYIHDYLMKRKFHDSAKAFQMEAELSMDPVAIDAPGGFLFEWWSVFWDIFIARTNEKHSEAASSYNEIQSMKAREFQQKQQQQQQQLQSQKPQQQHQPMNMQQLLMQRQAQQQQRSRGSEPLNSPASTGLLRNDAHIVQQNHSGATALATKMYEDRLMLTVQRDPLNNEATQQRMGESVGRLMDSNHVSALKGASVGCPPSGQTLRGTSVDISGNLRAQNQKVSGSTQDITSNVMASIMNPQAASLGGSLIGFHGLNQGSGNLTLRGWPLTGLDPLRPGLFHQPKSMMQQPLLLQPQQNQPSSSSFNDLESRRLRILLNSSNQNMGFGKDGPQTLIRDAIPNVGSSVLPHGDTEVLIKNTQLKGDTTKSLYLSEASKNQSGRKRKHSMSSSGATNISGTANTVGPSPSSPLTPSTHTSGDLSVPTLAQNACSDKSLVVVASDGYGLGSHTSGPNDGANADQFVDDGSFDDNVESFLSHDESGTRNGVDRFANVSKGFTFEEIQLIQGSAKAESCHFSSDGKLLATGGHNRKAILTCTESFTIKSELDEHSQVITDVRFSPRISRVATASADRTVRVWDVDNPEYSLRTFIGHSSAVMSLDFHPSKDDLICSCDNNSEIRYWRIKNGSCAGVFKGGATELRFQPHHGKILAAAAENFVSLLDVETQVCRLKLQGHKNDVNSVCWDSSGKYLASVSNDLVRVWSVSSGSEAECVHELNSNGNKFHTCVFHPTYSSLLVIGCYETLELWKMTENETMTIQAHDDLVTALAVSNVTGLVASASHDKCVKLWK